MNEEVLAVRKNAYQRSDIQGYDALAALALDMHSSWNHSADRIWKQLDAELWELTHNPWAVLQAVSREKLEESLADQAFCQVVEELTRVRRETDESPAWFQQTHGHSSLTCAAYFSMEFMLGESLPIYSGGLGNVAGDQLKAASDLGVPVIGLGLLYQVGYFRQVIDKEGAQQVLYPYNDPMQLPITPLRKPDGEWLRIKLSLPGWLVWFRTWQVKVGRLHLYLLDSNDPANYPAYRGITSELYGGGTDLRLKQELLLGLGGWRVLDALGIKPEVCHLNEGHAAFAVIERAYSFMKETGLPFEEALAATRAGNLFTTHTAVPAGFDRFPSTLIDQYLGNYAETKLKIPMQTLLALGRLNPNDPNEPFNMAYLAIRGSGAVNGVSRLHGKVSRKIFEPLFPRWPTSDVPIGSVTNGVHAPSWDSCMADELWTGTCGKSRWLGKLDDIAKEMKELAPAKIWKMRNAARKQLVEFARTRLARQMAARGASHEDIEHIRHIFDPNTLTLGFARRFATYKRPNILLQNPERLLRILNHPQYPVQLILAGKAHPADKPGQALIQEWMRFIMRPEVRGRVIFLSDYDMLLTEQLVQGVDVWLNTPERPWEACGTSGMKVLVNGGLNLSELDGWWAEAYTPEVGWALGDGKEHGGDPRWTTEEANALYNIIEGEVVPGFYTRDSEGIPMAWVMRIRESMARLTPQFSANRAVREYTEQHYIPAAEKYLERAANKGAYALEIVKWKHVISEGWPVIRFGETKAETKGERHEFEVQVYLDDIPPNFICVEIYADGVEGKESIRREMTQVRKLQEDESTFIYRASVPAAYPVHYYSARVIPQLPEVAVPLEMDRILWNK